MPSTVPQKRSSSSGDAGSHRTLATFTLVLGTIVTCTSAVVLWNAFGLTRQNESWSLLLMLGALPPIAFAAARPHAEGAAERWMAEATPQVVGMTLVVALFATGFFAAIQTATVVPVLVVAGGAMVLAGVTARPDERAKIWLGIGIGLAITVILFTACVFFVLSMLGGW